MSKPYICSNILCGCDGTLIKENEIAKVIHNYNTERNYDWHIRFPEITIDGICAIPEFIGTECGLSLIIYCMDAWMYKKKRLITMDGIMISKPILYKKTYIEKREKYTIDDYNMILQKISKDLRDMKFNKVEGVFYTSDNSHPLLYSLVGSEDENLNCLSYGCGNVDECCVCLDDTKTTTPCGHKLCVACWVNIKMVKRRLPCPICRENLRQREKLSHLFPLGYIGLDNLYEDFYDRGGDGGGDEDGDHDYTLTSYNSIIGATYYDDDVIRMTIEYEENRDE